MSQGPPEQLTRVLVVSDGRVACCRCRSLRRLGLAVPIRLRSEYTGPPNGIAVGLEPSGAEDCERPSGLRT